MPTEKEWELINEKITEVTRLIQKSGLTMVSATYGTDDEINHWQYKFWIPKSKIKKTKESNCSERLES